MDDQREKPIKADQDERDEALFGLPPPKQTDEKEEDGSAEDESRKQRAARAMRSVQAQLGLVERVSTMMNGTYQSLLEVESDMIIFLNRKTRWSIFAMDEVDEADKWPDTMKRLTAIADLKVADTAYTALADSVYIVIGKSVSKHRSELRKLGKDAEARYKEIRDPAWPSLPKQQEKVASANLDTIADTIKKQSEGIREWLRDVTAGFQEIVSGIKDMVRELKATLGITSLSEKDLDDYLAQTVTVRHNQVTILIDKALSPSTPRNLVQSVYLADWNRIRAFLSVRIWQALELEMLKVDRDCEKMIKIITEQIPTIND